MQVLSTPYDISDFTRKVLISANSPVRLDLHPHLAALTITANELTMMPREATITCSLFAARILPSLRAAFFRAQVHRQLLTCDMHWLRYQAHTHLLAEDVDYYFTHELDLLDREAALKTSNIGHRWPCVVLTFGSHHVHMHGAHSLQRARQGYYTQEPFISRLWPSQALTRLQHELQRANSLTQPCVVYNPNLFDPIRMRRKLQLLAAS